jgi:hypothetical protein
LTWADLGAELVISKVIKRTGAEVSLDLKLCSLGLGLLQQVFVDQRVGVFNIHEKTVGDPTRRMPIRGNGGPSPAKLEFLTTSGTWMRVMAQSLQRKMQALILTSSVVLLAIRKPQLQPATHVGLSEKSDGRDAAVGLSYEA